MLRQELAYLLRASHVTRALEMPATTYKDLPNELRAVIFEHRTAMRKDAAIIIFRNLAKNLIIKRLRHVCEQIIEEQLEYEEQLKYELQLEYEEQKDPYYTAITAAQYGKAWDDVIATYNAFRDEPGGKLEICYDGKAFVSDIRNLKIDYDLFDMGYEAREFGIPSITENVQLAHEVWSAYRA